MEYKKSKPIQQKNDNYNGVGKKAFQFKDNRSLNISKSKQAAQLMGLDEEEEDMQLKADTTQKMELDEEDEEFPMQQKENNTGLPDNLKSGMENLSGMNLDHVQTHYNSPKPAAVQAHAYAQGSTIHLASGQEKHLPHELAHVVQQAQGRVQPTTSVNGMAVNDNVGLEKEADVMGEKAVSSGRDNSSIQTKRVSSTLQPIQRVNKLGFEIEFRKNPIFRKVGMASYGKAKGFLSGTVNAAAVEQQPRMEMQPDAARASGIRSALDAIPEPWRSDSWAELRADVGNAYVPEVKTKVEYANNEGIPLTNDLDWIKTNWYDRYGTTKNVAETRDYTGGMFVGIPVTDIAVWTIRPATDEVGDKAAREVIVQALGNNLVQYWGEQNDPALHLQVTSGVDLSNVTDTFSSHADALTAKSSTVGGEDKAEALRAAKIITGAVALSNAIMNVYFTKHVILPNAGAVQGAWTLMFQDLLRLIVGVKRTGSSAKNTFTLMPRSTKVTLDTISQSITTPLLYNAIMVKAEMLLVGVLYKEVNINPDGQTLSFLKKIQEQIEGSPIAGPAEGEERWAYRFTSLFAAMDSFAMRVKNKEDALPWSVTGGREIVSPKENAILLEDRHINKFVTDWASLAALIGESLGNVQD
tara:strand:- start:86605 stop:88521 length:1917 start_codon:yes stop_codon:yes gene_type:complete